MKNFKKVSAPVRVDISACWPDCDPYRQDYGGFLLNAAIKQRVYTRRLNGDFVCSVREVPTNSGLGVSAAIRTTFMIASNTFLRVTLDLMLLAVPYSSRSRLMASLICLPGGTYIVMSSVWLPSFLASVSSVFLSLKSSSEVFLAVLKRFHDD